MGGTKLVLEAYLKLSCTDFEKVSECEKSEIFLVRIFLYSARMQENTDQKKLRILTIFTQG